MPSFDFSIADKIEKSLESVSYSENGVTVTCKPKFDRVEQKDSGTRFFDMSLSLTATNGLVSSTVDVNSFRIPLKDNQGYLVHNTPIQYQDIHDRAPGWEFVYEKGEYKVVMNNSFGVMFRFICKDAFRYTFAYTGESKKGKNVDLGIFYRSALGMSAEDIVNLFPRTNYVVRNMFDVVKKYTQKECREKYNPRELNYLNLPEHYQHIFEDNMSFAKRAVGKVLAKDITIPQGGQSGETITFKRGTVLSISELSLIDASDLSVLEVTHNDKVFTLHKFRNYNDRISGILTKQMLLEVLDVFSNNIMGYDYLANIYGIESRIESSLDSQVIAMVQDDVMRKCKSLCSLCSSVNSGNDKEIDLSSQAVADSSIILGTSLFAQNAESELNQGDKYVNKILNKLFSSEKGSKQNVSKQMADNSNLVALNTKDMKIVTNISTDATNSDTLSVQDLEEGRFDPYDSPESKKVGIVHNRTILSQKDEFGNLLSTFYRVHKGKVDKSELVTLTANEEKDRYIADCGETFVEEDGTPKTFVEARVNGDVITANVNDIEFIEASPFQNMSVAHACIPFPGHSNGKRITMSCNEQRQAVPTVKAARPFVNAGGESIVSNSFFTADQVLESSGEKSGAQLEFIDVIPSKDQKEKFFYFKVLRDGKKSGTITFTIDANVQTTSSFIFGYKLFEKSSNIYQGNDIVFTCINYDAEEKDVEFHESENSLSMISDNKEIFKRGLAMLNNLNVVIKTCDCSTIDDACVISDRLIADDQLTHIFLCKISHSIDNTGNTDHPDRFGVYNANYPTLTEKGYPEIGTILQVGDPVISVIKGEKNTNKIEYVKPGKEGQVVAVDTYMKGSESVCDVIIASRASISLGDKMAGRHGNKTVVAKIVPASQMPYIPETGFTADIIINPLGIPSRQNISQLLDIPLSLVMKAEKKRIVVSPYNSDDNAFVSKELEEHGIHSEYFVDGRTGLRFDRPSYYGVFSVMKLHHIARTKEHSVGSNVPLDSVRLQPKKGADQNGGQQIGEMETWAFECTGADYVLQELYSFRSDDTNGRSDVQETLNKGENVFFDIPKGGTSQFVNANDTSLKACYFTLGVDLQTTKNGDVSVGIVTDKLIRDIKKQVFNKEGLHDPRIFGNTRSANKSSNRVSWGFIDLGVEIVHPNLLVNGNLSKQLPPEDAKYYGGKVRGSSGSAKTKSRPVNPSAILYGRVFVNLSDKSDGTPVFVKPTEPVTGYEYERNGIHYVGGLGALVALLKTLKYSEYEDCLLLDPTVRKSNKDFFKRYKLSDYIISSFPVLPANYRIQGKEGTRDKIADFDHYYGLILDACNPSSLTSTEDKRQNIYSAIVSFLGLSTGFKAPKNSKDTEFKTFISFFTGSHDSGHGDLRRGQQSKRIDCSGRSVIITSTDPSMDILHFGLPYITTVHMFQDRIVGYIKKKFNLVDNATFEYSKSNWANLLTSLALHDKKRFARFYKGLFQFILLSPEEAMQTFDRLVHEVVEGTNVAGANHLDPQVILCGRQPTLHKFGIRAFYPRIVDGKAFQIHPLVCKGYNADFDGDTMWTAALITEEAKAEAIEKLSAKNDLFNPKDNKLILDHSQDMVLGMYYATMLKDNATKIDASVLDAIKCSSIAEITTLVDSNRIQLQSLVKININGRNYVSTAGRILFNSLLPDEMGFTSGKFKNTLHLKDADSEELYELGYDGIITGGSEETDPISYKIGKINQKIYDKYRDVCIDIYQKIMEFGFKYSDKSGLTLGFQDLMVTPEYHAKREQILANSEEIHRRLDEDVQNGLLTKEGRDLALTDFYKTQKPIKYLNRSDIPYPSVEIQKALLNSIDRNSNIYIIMNSGARGNKTQLMHMCGLIGILQKTKTKDMTTPVLGNYMDGLSSTEVHIASFSTRTGIVSTQKETGNAGYSTRTIVNMVAGFKIVEHKCNAPRKMEVRWGNIKLELCGFKPNEQWFNDNWKGKVIDPSNTEMLDLFGVSGTPDKPLDAVCFENANWIFPKNGIHRIKFTDGTSFEFDLSMLKECKPASAACDEDSLYVHNFLSKDGKYTQEAIDILVKRCVREVYTNIGVFKLRYALDPTFKSLLKGRVLSSGRYKNARTEMINGETYYFVNDDVLNQFEIDGDSEVPVRTLSTCKSKGGVCACCYGLKSGTHEFHEPDTFAGIESAHAIGEPAAQLTISLINKGGVAGASVASGIDIIKSLLNGSVPSLSGENNKSGVEYIVAPYSGFLKLLRFGEGYRLKLQRCRYNGSDLVVDPAFINLGKQITPAQNLLYSDGEYVRSGDLIALDGITTYSDEELPLKTCLVAPKDIMTYVKVDKGANSYQNCWGRDVDQSRVGDSDFEYNMMARIIQGILNYQHTFSANGISIDVRHFEVLSYVQNKFAITHDGSILPVNEAINNKNIVSGSDIVRLYAMSKDDVVTHNSGVFTRAAFEDVTRSMTKLATSNFKSNLKKESQLGLVAIGADFAALSHAKKNGYAPVFKDIQGPKGSIKINADNSALPKIESVTIQTELLNREEEIVEPTKDISDVNFDDIDSIFDSIGLGDQDENTGEITDVGSESKAFSASEEETANDSDTDDDPFVENMNPSDFGDDSFVDEAEEVSSNASETDEMDGSEFDSADESEETGSLEAIGDFIDSLDSDDSVSDLFSDDTDDSNDLFADDFDSDYGSKSNSFGGGE